MKSSTRGGVLGRRTFYLSEWRQGQLTPPALTWCPDDYDDLQAQMRGFLSADYYGLCPSCQWRHRWLLKSS